MVDSPRLGLKHSEKSGLGLYPTSIENPRFANRTTRISYFWRGRVMISHINIENPLGTGIAVFIRGKEEFL